MSCTVLFGSQTQQLRDYLRFSAQRWSSSEGVTRGLGEGVSYGARNETELPARKAWAPESEFSFRPQGWALDITFLSEPAPCICFSPSPPFYCTKDLCAQVLDHLWMRVPQGRDMFITTWNLAYVRTQQHLLNRRMSELTNLNFLNHTSTLHKQQKKSMYIYMGPREFTWELGH